MVEAIVLERLYTWLQAEETQGKGVFGERTWICKPIKSFLEELDYISEYLLKEALKRLLSCKLILIANGAQQEWRPREVMMWFTLTKEGWELMQRHQRKLLLGDFDPYLYWMQNLDPHINQMLKADIDDLLLEVGCDIYKKAVDEARRHNARAFSYVAKVAHNMHKGINFNKELPF